MPRPVEDTHSSMIREDEYQIDNACWRKLACTLNESLLGLNGVKGVNARTLFSRISSGVEGGIDLSSDGRRAAFKQFLMRGAS